MASQDEANPDQSMEEILQSIKKIIADEDDNPSDAQATQMEEATEEASASEDVLELTEMVEADGMGSSVDNGPMDMPEAETATMMPLAEPQEEPKTDVSSSDESALISEDVMQTSASLMSNLREQKPPEVAQVPTSPSMPFRSGATVEDLALEAMRPMLKEWLDANLASMVERIVEKEVRRISGQ
jgi:cell pole-organizing protein PopZ